MFRMYHKMTELLLASPLVLTSPQLYDFDDPTEK